LTLEKPCKEALYLKDLGVLLKEMGLQAAAQRKLRNSANDEFALGRLMAFHEVLSLMQQQALAFEIDLKEIGLSDITPEIDLV
jgi:hypothetical protein